MIVAIAYQSESVGRDASMPSLLGDTRYPDVMNEQCPICKKPVRTFLKTTSQEFDGTSETLPTESIVCQNPECKASLTRTSPSEAWQPA
jgi:hypothetical protein